MRLAKRLGLWRIKPASPETLLYLAVFLYTCCFVREVVRRDAETPSHPEVFLARDSGEGVSWREKFLLTAESIQEGGVTAGPNPSGENLGPTHLSEVIQGAWRSWENLGGAVQVLHHYLTTPTASCSKMVRMGGASCVQQLDGDKLVCLDPRMSISPTRDTLHTPSSCLVLSVGVGHDLTFDRAMTSLGCRVHAYDDDNTYDTWTRDQGEGLTFHRGRLATQSGFFTFCDQDKGLSSCQSFTHYTLQKLRRELGYGESQRLHYLKLDIEGAEWNVLSQAVKERWLEDVHQLAVEIHLEDLRDPGLTETQRRDVASSYLDVVASLEKSGFSLAAFTPNIRNPEKCSLDGVALPCYAEVLWLRQ